MADPNNNRGLLKGTRKRAGGSGGLTPPGLGSDSGSSLTGGVPCGACKFLRRKCVNGCIFAPHFSPEQGPALFSAVHKVFGASNVSKLLVQLPPHHRRHAVETILYEAQARLTDPARGCVSLIMDLYRQVTSLQMELAMAHRLIRERFMAANTPQGSLQQPGQLNNLDLQPVYSNGSSASNNNMINMNMFDSNQCNLANDHQYAGYSQPIYDPLLFTGPYFKNEDDAAEEIGDPLVFGDKMF